VVCVLAGLAATAVADKKGSKNGDLVKIDDVRDKLAVLQADGGHYVVILPFQISSEHFYFGDGKNLYQQRTMSGSAEGDKKFERHFWSPRVNHQGYIQYRDGAWQLKCLERTTPLAVVTDEAASKLLAEAKFHVPLWKRQGYALARDDRGSYYYVDRLRDEHGGKGFRLFVGMKGSMKLTKLVNVVSDSEGDIFSTRTGDLRLIWNRQGETEDVTWVKGKKRTKLTSVPMWKNIQLIYDELGAYEGEQLGTPCDYY